MTIVLASFFFSYYFVYIAGFPQLIKKKFKIKWTTRIKPFDCVTCLSVWVAVILFFTPEIYAQFLAVTFGAGFLGNNIK